MSLMTWAIAIIAGLSLITIILLIMRSLTREMHASMRNRTSKEDKNELQQTQNTLEQT